MDKYVILEKIEPENKYLVGFENGRIGYVTEEFERDSAIDLHSQWKLFKVSQGCKTAKFPTDEFGILSVEIKTLRSTNMGFLFRGAYVPEIKFWVYEINSYRRLTAISME
jgi:hypothetical protein